MAEFGISGCTTDFSGIHYKKINIAITYGLKRYSIIKNLMRTDLLSQTLVKHNFVQTIKSKIEKKLITK